MASIPAEIALGAEARGGQGTVGDYFALLKPRVMSLVIFTALVGIVAAPGQLHPWLSAVGDWQARWTGEFVNQGQGTLGEAWQTGMGPVENVGLFGVVEERREAWGDLRWMPRDRFDVSAGVGFRRIANENHVDGFTRTAWLARLALDIRY